MKRRLVSLWAVIAIAAMLLVSLAANLYLYYSYNNMIEELQNQNSILQDQLGNCQKGVPNLVTALGATYTWSPNSNGDRVYYLYIQGTVANEGNGTAYNCALKIVTNSLKDTFTDYYRFNALAPGEIEDIDTHLYHVDLVNWTITPECANTP